MAAMWEIPTWVRDVPLSSFQLLVAGGALLICAAVLILVERRRARVVLEASIVTEEMMAYLARIANALEGPRGPSSDEIADEVLVRLQEIANSKQNGKVRTMPVTAVERE